MRDEAQNIQNKIQEILDSDSELSESGLSAETLRLVFHSHKLNKHVMSINKETLLFIIKYFQNIKAQIENVIESDQGYYSDLESAHELTLLWFKYKRTGYLEPINKETLRILHIECQIRKILESDRNLKQLLPSPYELTQLWFSHKNLGYPDKINKSILLIFLISLLDNDNEANQNLHALLPGFNQLNQYPHFINSHKISKAAAGISLRKKLTLMYLNSISQLNQFISQLTSVNIFSFGSISLFDSFISQLQQILNRNQRSKNLITQMLNISMLNACAAGQIQLIKKLSHYLQNHRQPTNSPTTYHATRDDINHIFISRTNITWTPLNEMFLSPSIQGEIRDTLIINAIHIAIRFGGIETLRAVIETINTISDVQTAKAIIRAGFIMTSNGIKSILLLKLAQNGQIEELKFCINYITEHYPDDFPYVVNLVAGYEEFEILSDGPDQNDDESMNIFDHNTNAYLQVLNHGHIEEYNNRIIKAFNHKCSAYLQALSSGHIETAEYLYNLVINKQLSSDIIFTDEMLYTMHFYNLDFAKEMLIEANKLKSPDAYKYILQKIVQFYSYNIETALFDIETTIPKIIILFISILYEKTILFDLFSFIPDEYKEPLLNAFMLCYTMKRMPLMK